MGLGLSAETKTLKSYFHENVMNMSSMGESRKMFADYI